jgi:hypothetical protein
MTKNDWTIERKTYAQKQGYGKKEKIVEVTRYHVTVPTYEGTKECAVETLDEACDIIKQFIEGFNEIKKAKKEYDEFCTNNKWTRYGT